MKKKVTVQPWVFWRMVAEGRGEKKPQPIVSLNKAWKAACRAPGYSGRIPDDMRRSAVRNLVRAWIFERVAMMMTGHKKRSLFERCNITSPGDLRDAARLLDVASFSPCDIRERSGSCPDLRKFRIIAVRGDGPVLLIGLP